MLFRLLEKTEELDSAYFIRGETYDLGALGCDSFSAQVIADVDTPSAKTTPSADIDFATATWTEVAHGFTTGLKVQLTTSDTLPDPLATSTDYFVIRLSADEFQLAASLVNALAGTPITLIDAGVGDQTVTPTALAGASIKLQQSNDGTNWSDLGSATNITVDAVIYLEKDRPTSRYVAVYLTLTAGHISTDLKILGKGDRA